MMCIDREDRQGTSNKPMKGWQHKNTIAEINI